MDLTVLLTVHNEAEYAKLAIKGLRCLGNETEGLTVILIDNASTDNIGEWVREQQDICYVYMNEGLTPWGEVIRQVIAAFEIKTDILIMQCRFVLLSGAITRMQEVLYSDPKIAAVGCITSHAALIAQQPEEEIRDLGDIEEYEKTHGEDKPKNVMELDCGVTLIKKSAAEEQGLFCDDIFSLYALAKDISLELICRGWQMKVCRNVAVYELPCGYSEEHEMRRMWKQDIKTLEKKWEMHYFMLSGRNVLTEMIDAVPSQRIRIMEVGCDCGATLMEVRNLFSNAYTIGCEISPASAKIAKHVVDELYVANIEDEDLPIPSESLDYVLFGDVLEHLHDPLRVLKYIRGLLRRGGKVIACIPNVMHISVIRQLLRGDFTYEDYGLLDKTHIHLFTCNEILRMFREAGYEVEDFRHIDDDMEEGDEELIRALLQLDKTAKRYMYTAYWYTIRGVVK